MAFVILLIVSFEIGFSAGKRAGARLQPDPRTEVAAAKPAEDVASQLPAASKPAPKAALTDSPTAPKGPRPATPAEPAKKPDSSVAATLPKKEPAKPVEPERPVEPAVAIKYLSDIQPIFQSKCISCHGGLSKKGGLDLRSLASITRGGNNGPGVKPGQPDQSQVWQSIKEGQMPPPNKPQLSADEKQLILKWIASGAK